jgi:hypothetical protein
MPVTVTPATPRAGTVVTIAGSGLAASTAHVVTLAPASSSFLYEFKVTTDGAGAFSVPWVTPVQQFASQTWTVNVYANDPGAESSTTTISINIANATVAATTTFTEGPPSS